MKKLIGMLVVVIGMLAVTVEAQQGVVIEEPERKIVPLGNFLIAIPMMIKDIPNLVPDFNRKLAMKESVFALVKEDTLKELGEIYLEEGCYRGNTRLSNFSDWRIVYAIVWVVPAVSKL